LTSGLYATDELDVGARESGVAGGLVNALCDHGPDGRELSVKEEAKLLRGSRVHTRLDVDQLIIRDAVD
jgi:hypothetical protein